MLPKISVLITCKNEVKNLPACIASARLVADEVLVADSGSTDGTLELAHRLADRVIEREYRSSGDFKNWAIPQTRHTWVLILDADERVPVELAEEIQLRLAKSEGFLAYSIPRLNFLFGFPIRHGDWSADRVTRLLRRDDCRYKVHTDHSEIDVPSAELGHLKRRLIHYTAWEPNEYLRKMTHYAEQQAQLWYESGRRPEFIHMSLNAPMRFLRGYLLRGGFRDGMLGFFLASMTAYYSFLKQFFLWQLWHGKDLADVERTSVSLHDDASDRFENAA